MKALHTGMLATFFGVVFGSLIALSIEQTWHFGALGALISGVVAAGISSYILFDIKQIILAIPTSWNKVCSYRMSDETKENCKTNFKWTSGLFVGALAWSYLFHTQGTIIGEPNPILLLILTFIISLVPTLFFFLISTLINIPFPSSNSNKCSKEDLKIFIKPAWQSSPLFFIIIIFYIPKIITWVFKIALPFIGKFLKELFITIHCRDRVMCLVDSSIGMIAAFLIQQQFIVGGQLLSTASILAGGLIGIGAYFFMREIVAIRWLKVKPNGHTA